MLCEGGCPGAGGNWCNNNKTPGFGPCIAEVASTLGMQFAIGSCLLPLKHEAETEAPLEPCPHRGIP